MRIKLLHSSALQVAVNLHSYAALIVCMIYILVIAMTSQIAEKFDAGFPYGQGEHSLLEGAQTQLTFQFTA